ncbi:MAG: hypothetical protein A3J85_03200 [Desulfobacula sp. RIFOXYA12_FULL_46_16]|nr:MAG: hypothetical protein A3J85_03200 [Desulfobacula sp. RIFOXYA12_FULL_46_16]
MAVGWARDGAVQEQMDADVQDAVERARRRLPCGKSLTHCRECGEIIPEPRRKAVPGVSLCVPCQSALEARQAPPVGYNRRAGKDSQLK